MDVIQSIVLNTMNFSQPYPSARSPVMGDNMVATSQPLAAQAGLRMLERGGNAVDAALAAAMTLIVVEPTGCGLGSDAFAILWDGQQLHGLNASGRAPRGWTREHFAGRTAIPLQGWDSVTVPGVVSAWVALSQRFGLLPLATVAEPAIRYAREGFPVSPIIARAWHNGAQSLAGGPGFAETFLSGGSAPRAGERYKLPDHARSLELIAETAGEAFYRGVLAERMIKHAAQHGAAMTPDDLAEHEADWIDPIAQSLSGAVVHELPPNGQGITTLITLGILKQLGVGSDPVDDIETLHLIIEATKLAMVDTDHFVGDLQAMQVSPSELLDPGYLAERARLVDRKQAGDPGHGTPRPGGTVYLAAADRSGMMVSFIQSNYMGFGSGVVVPGTGISLQNRGSAFSLKPGHVNEVGPRKRPFHTVIPGFATRNGAPLMAFGVMGGPMQAQGHTQIAVRTLLYGQNPQAAADAPRWRVVSGRTVAIEASFDPTLADALRARGHDIVVEAPDAVFAFGGVQAITRTAAGYVGGSDPRKDGQAVAF